LAAELLDALSRHADPGRAASERAYLKSTRDFLGVTVPTGRRVVREFVAAHPGLDHDVLVATASALWDGPFFECRRAAVELLADQVALLGAGDLSLLESLIRDGETWALVDGLSHDVVGRLLEGGVDRAAGRVLDRWSRDGSFWVRRASMLALLRSLRSSLDEWDRFCGYAEAMLDEREFFIRKAIGWVLRDVSRLEPEVVRAWVEPRLPLMSGVTRREATKYLGSARERHVCGAMSGIDGQ
jgi:3-methyladenine DNA glycosylase AlkD